MYEVPLEGLVRSLKAVLIVERFPLSLFRLLEKVLRPVKKEVPLVVTLPFNKSSVKIANEQLKFWKEGPTFEADENPILSLNYHSKIWI